MGGWIKQGPDWGPHEAHELREPDVVRRRSEWHISTARVAQIMSLSCREAWCTEAWWHRAQAVTSVSAAGGSSCGGPAKSAQAPRSLSVQQTHALLLLLEQAAARGPTLLGQPMKRSFAASRHERSGC
jgi:hypothetical protein